MKRKLSLFIVLIGTIGLLSTIIARALAVPLNPLGSALGSFKYFTIQSNLIIVIYFWLLYSLKPTNKIFESMLGASVVYITVTFIVFFLFLDPTWSPKGLELVGSIINHYITPILSIIFLIIFRKKYNFTFKSITLWLIYPLLYLAFVIIYGSNTNNYFYPFLEIDEIGVTNFIINCFGLLIFFTFLSSIYVLITKKRVRE